MNTCIASFALLQCWFHTFGWGIQRKNIASVSTITTGTTVTALPFVLGFFLLFFLKELVLLKSIITVCQGLAIILDTSTPKFL